MTLCCVVLCVLVVDIIVNEYDVVIVGGSTAGSSAAYHLTAAGVRVLVSEPVLHAVRGMLNE
jgi:ribulose 1,5-bisphosphate synthetase/thiazole synthase